MFSIFQVTEISATLGYPTAFRLQISSSVPDETKKEKHPFIIVPKPTKKIADDSNTDEIDLGDDNSAALTTSVEVQQRVPLMTMTLLSADPVLIGEWFAITVVLDNGETEDDAHEVEVRASLVDALDPLIADTTKIMFAGEEAGPPQTPATPVAPAETTFQSPPVLRKKLDTVKRGAKTTARLLLKASTSGTRAVKVETVYSVTAGPQKCTSSLKETLHLETQDPFSLETALQSLRFKELGLAYTDEPFLVLPTLKSLGPHGIAVRDSWLEPRQPVTLEKEDESQLADCRLYQDCVARECHVAEVKGEDLPASSLDVQELPLGKYVVKWSREGEEDDEASVTTTTFDLGMARVSLGSLFVQADLPAFGVVRTPMPVRYDLSNRTDKVN